MNTAQPRRPRPHPARRARKIAGTLSITSLLALTGCMVAAAKTSTGTQSTSVAASNTSATTAVATGDDSTVSSRSTTVAAVAGTASTQSNTSSHAS